MASERAFGVFIGIEISVLRSFNHLAAASSITKPISAVYLTHRLRSQRLPRERITSKKIILSWMAFGFAYFALACAKYKQNLVFWF
jgi:hypothetical protein